MKRLKLLILGFCLAVSVPLAYVARQTYQSLALEESAKLRFFSQTLFDEMEDRLAELVQREESRAVDEYHHTLADGDRGMRLSPLARSPEARYILGYLQNNPDGSFQTPLTADLNRVPREQRRVIDRLRSINSVFNRKKWDGSPGRAGGETAASGITGTAVLKQKAVRKLEKEGLADRYLARSPIQAPKRYLGRQAQRTEEITVSQARNLSAGERQEVTEGFRLKGTASPVAADITDAAKKTGPSASPRERAAVAPTPDDGVWEARRFQVEVTPMQSVRIDDDHYFVFRRIAIDRQIYRQGFVIEILPFLNQMAADYFEGQPMARFAELGLRAFTGGGSIRGVRAGARVSTAGFITERTFPAPFDFLTAQVLAENVPPSPARRTLNLALLLLGVVILLGLVGIYQSARAVVSLSERRSRFVSSVTHELKTPLTNIRMYIEMLEQGIAASPEREQTYLQIVGSESARLSRLINNVLEMARLEKRQRKFDMITGDLKEVLAEVQEAMKQKLLQEGFSLGIEVSCTPRFAYDRDALIQILINLIENSIKFGRQSEQRGINITAASRSGWIDIAVVDSGPGIPPSALKKVFDDFYRADNELTRTTGGTGIGLSLVKKLAVAMGGKVHAANNPGPGCTVTVSLPVRSRV